MLNWVVWQAAGTADRLVARAIVAALPLGTKLAVVLPGLRAILAALAAPFVVFVDIFALTTLAFGLGGAAFIL